VGKGPERRLSAPPHTPNTFLARKKNSPPKRILRIIITLSYVPQGNNSSTGWYLKRTWVMREEKFFRIVKKNCIISKMAHL
jgi:hypothetical protein